MLDKMASILQAMSEFISSNEEDESFVKNGAKPFVKIINGKLSFVNNVNINTKKDIRVLSILGKARMGKSTLFNTIISQLTKKNQKVFQTQDNDEHCTRGINGYFLKEHDLLLLDCQGLALENSSHDPTLLLLVYLISDVIVFNERMMLQNEALKLMEPICTFMTYIDMDSIKKPTLVFRVSDADLVKDTNHNLKKVLSPYADQYQSIRDSILHLFESPIELVKTNPLERSHKQMLEKNDYLSLLKDSYVGFNDAVSKILSFLGSGQNPTKWLQNVSIIIEQINNNEKINYKKLDIVELTQKNEIQEWVLSLPSSLFSSIDVDHTQTMYDKNVEPRKLDKKNSLTSFTKKFKNLPKSTKEDEYRKLEERLNAPIKIATLKAENVAQTFLENGGWISRAHNSSFPVVSSETQSFSSRNDAFWNHYFQHQDALVHTCKDHNIYAPVTKDYTDWVNEIKSTVFKTIDKFKKEESEEVEKIDTILTKMYQSYIDDKFNMIETTNDIEFTKKTNTSYIDSWKNECITAMTTAIQTTTMNREITCSIGNLDCMYLHSKETNITRSTTYDLISPLIDKYSSAVNIDFTSCFLEAIKNKKIELLQNKVIDTTKADKLHPILEANPEIEWVCDLYKGFEGILMTKDTYLKNIYPIHKKVIDKMISKGYISESDDFNINKKNSRYSKTASMIEFRNKNNVNIYNPYMQSFYNDNMSYIESMVSNSISCVYLNYYNKEFLLTPNKETMFEDVDNIKLPSVPEVVVDIDETSSKSTELKSEVVDDTLPGIFIINGKIENKQVENMKYSTSLNKVLTDAEDKRLERIAHSWAYDS